jgi:NADH-ubiquinone oxidoreductase chain 4
LGSLFLLLSILAMSSIMSTTDFDTLFKGYFMYLTQLFLFYGIFIAFAVKTPTIFLNTWLLKAHVESPLGGSIILAAIVLKLSLYGILRLILPILPKAYMEYTYIIFLIGVISIVYASLSTLRTIDVKELIAYSSVSHAAVYLLGVFSNSIQGIEGAINLGLAHGLVSPGLFICAGGVLYDRSSTRVISFYRGVTQLMPLFSILFFLLCLSNCGAPLSLNFIGEFLSLYGVFERSSLFGVFASSSIIFSAAYTIYMYQRIAFGGVYSRMFTFSMPDLTKREFTVLLLLVIPTVFFGIYPGAILDAVHYSVSTLIYSFDFNVISCDASLSWGLYFKDIALLAPEQLQYIKTVIAFLLIVAFVTIAERKNKASTENILRSNPLGCSNTVYISPLNTPACALQSSFLCDTSGDSIVDLTIYISIGKGDNLIFVPVTIEGIDEFKADLTKSIHKANPIPNNKEDSLVATKKASLIFKRSTLCACSL